MRYLIAELLAEGVAELLTTTEATGTDGVALADLLSEELIEGLTDMLAD